MSNTDKKITVKDIRQAIENEELVLFYQPKISLINGNICGAEALIRWKKPDGSLIPPFKFIPIAEETDLIRYITLYVFNHLIIDMALITAIDNEIVVSFNASGKDFNDDVFTEIIIQAIKNKYIDAKNLEIEVTETVLLDETTTKTCLTRLADAGISIAMDDFGAGHSGLTSLSKWPFTTIKIDKSLIDDIMKSNKKHSLIQATIRMAHQLNLNIVAEGVEDMSTYRMLQNYGCKVVQGYVVGRPMNLEHFIHYYNTYESYPAKPIGLLYMAQLDHVQWRKGIIDAAIFLNNSTEKREFSQVRSCPELNHTKCKLGRWYYSHEAEFENEELYKAMEKPHQELHLLGYKLLKKASEHCSFDEFNELTRSLSKKSMEVLETLQNMENYLSMKDLSGGQGF
ncbi:MAG: hypothetical protein COA86_18510 [Kangiella sp.]|nr:MAG: hypothetical protein COA86_18510 [Kangiella sp.]